MNTTELEEVKQAKQLLLTPWQCPECADLTGIMYASLHKERHFSSQPDPNQHPEAYKRWAEMNKASLLQKQATDTLARLVV